jgi:hypothetical protein
MKIKSTLFLCILLLIYGTVVRGQGGSNVQLGNSPSPEIALAHYSADQHPGFASPNPRFGGIPSESFVLTNHSNRAIVALSVLWTMTQPDGRQTPNIRRNDSFMLPNSSALVPPNSRILVTPKALLREGLAGSARMGGGTAAGQGGGAASPTVAAVKVDCVIFEDGELVGPNETHCDEEIQSRKIAADSIVRQVRNAQARGEDPAIVLRQVAQARSLRTDYVAQWTNQYATQLLALPVKVISLENQLAGLEKIPTPPKFFRTTK